MVLPAARAFTLHNLASGIEATRVTFVIGRARLAFDDALCGDAVAVLVNSGKVTRRCRVVAVVPDGGKLGFPAKVKHVGHLVNPSIWPGPIPLPVKA